MADGRSRLRATAEGAQPSTVADPPKTALGRAVKAWWASGSDHDWRILLAALVERVFKVARRWGAQQGFSENTSITTDDLAGGAIQRFLWEFSARRGPDGTFSVQTIDDEVPIDPDEHWGQRRTGLLTRLSLADMKLTHTPDGADAWLVKRAIFEFQEIARRSRGQAQKEGIGHSFDREDGGPVEVSGPPTDQPENRFDAAYEPTAAEKLLAERWCDRLFASRPKTNQLTAFILQLCLLDRADAIVGQIPAGVLARLDRIRSLQDRQVVQGTRRRADAKNRRNDDTEPAAVQATVIARFMNGTDDDALEDLKRQRSTASDRVAKFETFLREQVWPECNLANLDFVAVCRHLLSQAVDRLRAGAWAVYV